MVKIDVTAEDIDGAQWAMGATRCPIALAARRAGLVDPLVHGLYIEHTVGRERVRSWIPLHAQNFIRAFDQFTRVYPMDFEVDPLGDCRPASAVPGR